MNLRRSLKNLSPYLVGAIVPMLVLIVVGPILVYQWGLSLAGIGQASEAPPERTELVRMIFWSAVEASPEMELRRLSPWSFLALLYCGSSCDGRYPGHQIALRAARQSTPTDLRGVGRHAAQAAGLIWLSRNRTSEVLTDMAAEESYFGGGAEGLDAAAAMYFGKSARELEPHEVSFLATLTVAPARILNQAICQPTVVLSRRNELIRKSALNPEWHFGRAGSWTQKPLGARLPAIECPEP